MPSSTFLNLPPEKQEKLLEAATREFSTRPFNEASINQIIKEAGIPRGSFYMYFQDKEELFRYLLRGYVDQMVMVIEELLLRRKGDIFQALLDLYDYLAAKGGAQHLGGDGGHGPHPPLQPGHAEGRPHGDAGPGGYFGTSEGRGEPRPAGPAAGTGPGRHAGTAAEHHGSHGLCRLQAGAAPGVRERLENILDILRRGMGKTPREA